LLPVVGQDHGEVFGSRGRYWWANPIRL
jgi:hypothetical protein